MVERYFEVSLFLLLTVGFLALASTGRVDIFTILLVSGALITKALRYRRHQEPELSPQTVTGLTWFYFIFYALDFFVLSADFLVATTHLVLFIAVIKLFSARTNRDYLWLALVAFMEILAAATLTVDTTFLVFFFLFLVLGVSTFVSFEIKRSSETTRTAGLTGSSGLGRRLQQSLVVTSLSVAVATLALATAFFFILPRFTTGFMRSYAFQPEQLSGFSNEVNLGEIGSIKLNPAVVMRIRSQQGDSRELEGLKWRGLALARFDGRRWSAPPFDAALWSSRSGRYDLPETSLRDPDYLAKGSSRRVYYRVLLEPLSADVLFAAAVPLEISGRLRMLQVHDSGSLTFLLRAYTQLGYDVVSDVGQPDPSLVRQASTDYPPEILENYLQLPPLDPRVPELAQRVVAGQENPYDQARALENHLRTQYGYTLELPSTPEQDPVARFLFERRQGHCEYFASAMTVMLRSQGTPARMISGFLTGEYNEVGENFIVRASDAHTWVEAYFPGIGWLEFDPTPPDPNQRQPGWWRTTQHYLDAFDLWWDEWVINYDELHYVQFLQNLRQAVRQARQSRYWLRQKRRELTASLNQLGQEIINSPYALPGGLALVLGLALLLHGSTLRKWLHAQRLLRRNGNHSLNAGEATLLYQRLLGLLRRRGFRKAPAQTPLEFAASLPPPELAGPVDEFTRLYNQVRFGQAPAPTTRLIELMRQVESWKTARRPARSL